MRFSVNDHDTGWKLGYLISVQASTFKLGRIFSDTFAHSVRKIGITKVMLNPAMGHLSIIKTKNTLSSEAFLFSVLEPGAININKYSITNIMFIYFKYIFTILIFTSEAHTGLDIGH